MRDGNFQNEQNLRDRCIQFLIVLIKEITNRVPENVDDIIPLLHYFNKSPNQIEVIVNQWQKIHLMPWTNISDTAAFWSEVLGYTNSDGITVFSQLAKFVLALMTLPHSNADIERLFSQMNIIRSK
jgi:hypothetical protein